MPDVSLSTMWMQDCFERPRDFFCAGVAMGFRSFELTSVAGAAFYDDIHPGEFDIRSLHNPAPGDIDSPPIQQDEIHFTSLDEEQRRLAVAVTRRSIDVAVRYGAQTVVLHCGRTEAQPQHQAQLECLATEGRGANLEADVLRALLASQRQSHYEEHMAALMRSLDELIPYAAARGIHLGLENRRRIHQVPNFEEMQRLLGQYSDGTLGYWHDVGHAETQAAAGMTSHEDWLRSFAPRLLGVHLHDLVGFQDHCAPGTGGVDWQRLAALVPDHGLRTVEIRPETPASAVCASLDLLIASGWIRA